MQKLVFSIILIMSFAVTANAMKMTPFKMYLEPSGENKTKILKIENNSNEKIAVEITTLGYSTDVNGKEQNYNSEQDFNIYPPQMIIPANSSQSIRVEYIGKPELTKELSYRIIAEQLPITFNKKNNKAHSVNFLFNFRGLLFVTPRNASEHLEIKSYEVKDKNKLELLINNCGNKHVVILNPSLSINFKNDKNPTILSLEKNKINNQTILAHSDRKVNALLPDHFDRKIDSISLNYKRM